MGFRSGCERTKSPRSEQPRFPRAVVDFRKQPKGAASISLCVPRQAYAALTASSEAKAAEKNSCKTSIPNYSQPDTFLALQHPLFLLFLSPRGVLLPPCWVPADPPRLLSPKPLSPHIPPCAPFCQAPQLDPELFCSLRTPTPFGTPRPSATPATTRCCPSAESLSPVPAGVIRGRLWSAALHPAPAWRQLPLPAPSSSFPAAWI